MQKLLDFLKGRKTHFFAALGAIVVVLRLFQVLDEPISAALLGFLGFGAVSALRAGVNKLGPNE